MVNHYYTLLLNLHGEYLPEVDTLCDVYRPTYVPLTIPPELIPLDHALFGDCDTDDKKQQRVYHLLYLLSGSDLAHLATEFDNRITYSWPIRFNKLHSTTDLLSVLDRASIFSESTLAAILADDVVRLYYFEAGTFVDRTSALVVAYARAMNNEYQRSK